MAKFSLKLATITLTLDLYGCNASLPKLLLCLKANARPKGNTHLLHNKIVSLQLLYISQLSMCHQLIVHILYREGTLHIFLFELFAYLVISDRKRISLIVGTQIYLPAYCM